ncbi:prosaposin-like [Silurus meridionalis]|nr:prosaposin-like [Silurus meridionalis]
MPLTIRYMTRLKGTLEGVCDLLPEQIKDQCHNEMDKDLPLVLTFLVGLMNPGQMCTYLNLCEGEFKLQMEDILMNYVQKTITPTSVMCESFTQRYGEQLRWILGKEAVALDVCEVQNINSTDVETTV